jgi:hypothetical protein
MPARVCVSGPDLPNDKTIVACARRNTGVRCAAKPLNFKFYSVLINTYSLGCAPSCLVTCQTSQLDNTGECNVHDNQICTGL